MCYEADCPDPNALEALVSRLFDWVGISNPFTNLSKAPFCHRQAVIAQEMAAVLLNGEEVGRVSKFTYSFVKEHSIGYILAKKGTLTPGTKVQIHGYEATHHPRPQISLISWPIFDSIFWCNPHNPQAPTTP